MQKLVNRKGFTLVELVVVIAVLAILAGIGVVAYNGYIEKAREAADLELLGAVNTAFALACAEKGVAGLPPQGEAKLEDGKVSSIKYGLEDEADTDLTAAFMQYYEGNEDKGFNYYQSLGYNPSLGGFYGDPGTGTIILPNGMKLKSVDNGNGTTTYTVTDDDGNEYTYIVNNSSMEAYGVSTFGQNMTASGLMKDIDNVAETFANFLKPPSPFSSQASKFAEALGVTLDASDPDYYKKLGNAMVLGVADASFDSGFDAKSIAGKWYSDKYSVSIDTKNLNNTAAQLALGYALATGFANSEIGKTQKFNFGGESMTAAEYYQQQTEGFSGKTGFDALQAIQTMLGTMIESDGYKEYYAATGEADIDGYLGALDAIKNNRDTLESGNNVVDNPEGFSNDDLGVILDALFG